MRCIIIWFAVVASCLTGLADPHTDAVSAMQRGQALEKQQKYAEAAAEYGRAIAALPYEVEPYIARGWARHLAKDETGALADLEMALTYEENDLRARYRRGLVRKALGDFAAAAEDFDVVADADPKNARARYELANALARTRRHRDALAPLDEAISLDPAKADYFMLRSAIAEKLGDGAGAVADNDKARTLTTDPRMIANLEKVRPRLLALKEGRPLEPSANSLLGGETRPDPAKIAAEAQAAVAQAEALPPAQPLPDLQVQLPAQIDFRRLSKTEYRAAVSAAMEQLRFVLGPRSEAETDQYEKTWRHAFDFPAETVIEYLNRLNPLLARFLALRTATTFTLDRFNETWQEAMTAAGYGHAAGADALFQEAHAYGRQLRTLRDDLAKVGDAITALGDPPDVAALKKKRRKQADAAMQYVQSIADGEIWTRLREMNHVNIQIKATGEARLVGTSPKRFALSESDAFNLRRYESVEPVNKVDFEPIIDRYFSCRIEWVDRCFFGHFTSLNDGDQSDTRIYGTIAEDGRRLIELALVSVSNSKGHEGTHRDGDISQRIDRTRAIRIAGLPYFDDPGRGRWVNFALVDPQSGQGPEKERGYSAGLRPSGKIAEALHAYLAETTAQWSGILADGSPAQARNVTTITQINCRLLEVSFTPVNADEAPMQPDAVVAGESARDYFREPHPWAKIGRDITGEKFAKLAALLRTEADVALAEAKRRAAEKAAAEKAVLAAQAATYAQDIESIRTYLTGVEADRNRAAAASPCDDTLVGQLDFLIAGQRSEIQAKRDMILSLQTGEIVHTRTPFDDMCRAQVEGAAQADVDRLATVDRARRANATLQARLDDHDRRNLVQQTGAMIDAGGGMDPERWRALNASAYEKVQAKLGTEKNAADAETLKWERRVWAAETTETAAGLSFGLLSGAGGYRAAGLLYSFTTSGLNNGLDSYYTSGSEAAGLKAGLFEGTKAVITSLSDTVDYTWSAVDAYQQDPQAPFRDRLQSVVTATGAKWLMGKATGYVGEAIAAKIDLGKPSTEWKPTAKQAFAAAQHRQQMDLDQALARDFLDTAKRQRALQLKSGGAASPELDQLTAEVRRKACAVNSSFGAKVYLKTAALPVEQRLYSRAIDGVHDELIPQFRALMQGGRDVNGRAIGKWGQFEVAPLRNASSAGTASMDFDLALRQQPDWVPDGAGGVRRNAWLTCDGRPVAPREFQETGQKVWEDLYRRQTGYSPKAAFENITTLDHSEAYKDLAWTRLTRGRDGAVMGTDAINWRWSQQAGDVTRVKHYEMLDRQPQLGHYEKLQESCRGTAKDVKSKVLTMLDEIAQTKGRTMNLADRTQLEETRVFWGRVQTVMNDFGSGKLPPLEAEKQIYLLSGGRGIGDLTDRVGTVIESLGKKKK